MVEFAIYSVCFIVGIMLTVYLTRRKYSYDIWMLKDQLTESKRSEENLLVVVAGMKDQIIKLEETRVVINIPDGDPDAVVIDR